VARAEGFGVLHIVDVLAGADTDRIRQRRHDRLSTYGLLADLPRKALIALVHQLLDQRLLERTPGDRPVLRLNQASWAVLRGQRNVQLVQPKQAPVAKPRFDEDSWEGVDKGLFEHLRQLRRSLADERGVPPYIIFGDATLRDLARLRPSSPSGFAAVRGVGQKKLVDLGPAFLAHIRQYCDANGLTLDSGARR
jgi:ATP-dependent DNA helicase RecQ